MAFSENTFLGLTNLEVLKTCMFYYRKETKYPGEANWGASEWKVKHFFQSSTFIPTNNQKK